MSQVVKGRGVAWSVGDMTFTGGIASVAVTFMNQSVDFIRAWERRAIQDNGGTTRAVVFFNGIKQIRLTCFPYGSTQANGRTAVETMTPAAGANVVVALATAEDLLIEGTYHVVSAQQRRVVNDAIQIDMELESGDEGNDITTLIS